MTCCQPGLIVTPGRGILVKFEVQQVPKFKCLVRPGAENFRDGISTFKNSIVEILGRETVPGRRRPNLVI